MNGRCFSHTVLLKGLIKQNATFSCISGEKVLIATSTSFNCHRKSRNNFKYRNKNCAIKITYFALLLTKKRQERIKGKPVVRPLRGEEGRLLCHFKSGGYLRNNLSAVATRCLGVPKIYRIFKSETFNYRVPSLRFVDVSK